MNKFMIKNLPIVMLLKEFTWILGIILCVVLVVNLKRQQDDKGNSSNNRRKSCKNNRNQQSRDENVYVEYYVYDFVIPESVSNPNINNSCSNRTVSEEQKTKTPVSTKSNDSRHQKNFNEYQKNFNEDEVTSSSLYFE